MYSLARVRVELGKYREAEPVLENLLVAMPHLSLAEEMMATVKTRLGSQ
jgi:hypothetical protein